MREYTGSGRMTVRGMNNRSRSTMLLTIVLCLSLADALAPLQNATSEAEAVGATADRGARAAALATTLVPSAYRIHITPNYTSDVISTTEFGGRVEIDVFNSASTRTVRFHAGNGTKVNTVKITDSKGKIYTPTPSSDGEDIIKCSLSSSLPTGKSVFEITYTGMFQTEFNGFYKSTYKKSNTEDGVLFTTQFQPTHARKAFPCFDEPNFKATFLLQIDVPPNYSALSNTPIDTNVESPPHIESNLTTVTFQKTVNMSTYLVAFIVYENSSYTYVESNPTENISIKTWAKKEAIDDGLAEYSNEMTPLILLELENYTRISYQRDNMTKIDQAAIPHFSAGAMENWGMITYRETRLLFNETGDTEATRKSVAAVIAHELVHQWFGNLVTTKWWDTTWLNEGFARYLQYVILSRVNPEWRMMEQLLVDQQMSIFLLDAVDTAKHLSHDVTTPDQIKDQFGTITYSKGASFLRMISNAIGEENFENALHEYLVSNEYKAVTPNNLYEKLEKNTPEDRKPLGGLEKALETWTQQPGFPVLNVQRDYDGHINISQERFFADGSKLNSDTIYHIPITWSLKNHPEQFIWFSEKFITMRDLFDVPDLVETWILIHSRGYYRVMYDQANYMTLAWTMLRGKRTDIAAEDRAQLFDDSLALAAAGYLPYREAKYMMRCLSGETDVLPWAAATRGLDKLDSLLGSVDHHDIFYRYVRNGTEPLYKKLEGFSNNGSSIELIHRPTILRWACRAGNQDCVQNAVSLLKSHQEDDEELDPNTKSVIYCYGIMNGDNEMWNHLWNFYKNSTDQTERSSAIDALGCTKDRATLQMFLKDMWAGMKEEKLSEVKRAFSAALSHPAGIDITLQFILEQLPDFINSSAKDTADDILRNVASHISSEAQYNEFTRGLEYQFQQGSLPSTFVDELETTMEKNVKWVKKYGDDAFEALAYATPGKEYVEPPPPPTPKPSQGHYSTLQVQVLIVALTFLILTY